MPYNYLAHSPRQQYWASANDPMQGVYQAIRSAQNKGRSSVLLNQHTGQLHAPLRDNGGFGDRLGQLAYGASGQEMVPPIHQTEIDQKMSWLRPPDEGKMDVYTMADGTMRAGYEYAMRHNAMLDEGASLQRGSRPIYQGAEIDVVEVAEHLRVLKLLSRVYGLAPRKFHVARGYHHELAEFLDYRFVLADPNLSEGYRQGPFAEMSRVRSDFYEAEVTCRKDRVTVGYPYETMWRANKFNPKEVDAKNAAFDLAYKRNKSCIAELLNIENRVNKEGEATTSETLSQITARSNGKSDNNILGELQKIKTAQEVLHLVSLDTIQTHPQVFLYISQNDLLRGGGEFGRTPISMPSGGIVQFPTMPHVKVILDQRLPYDRLFFYERDTCLWLGEGPKRVDMLEEKSSQASYADVTDWYDAMCVHPQIQNDTDRRFGCTVYLHSGDF